MKLIINLPFSLLSLRFLRGWDGQGDGEIFREFSLSRDGSAVRMSEKKTFG